MIIRKSEYVLDVDMDSMMQYSREHSVSSFDEDRNFHVQACKKFPKLAQFLRELGLLIDRPDEIGSCAVDNYIDYHFVSYTVIGEILESDEYEIDMFDGELFLNIVINHMHVPNEQQTNRYFTVTVYNIKLPWVLDDPFPAPAALEKPASFTQRIKAFFHND